jgi:hypothetical protein
MKENIEYFVILVIATLLSIACWIAIVSEYPEQTRTQSAVAVQACPEGTYNVGETKTNEPLCKIIPTGCPYGDSIPLDMCDKFAPKPEPIKEVEPVQEQEFIDYGGK